MKAATREDILQCVGVTKYFGGLAAVKDVSFKLREKEILGLIGPNGAGKTTLFNLISGVYPVTSGKIYLYGREITGLEAYEICHLGIGRTFQVVRPFLKLTALENVATGILFGKDKPKGLKKACDEAINFLDFVGLIGKKDVPARSLTLMERKRLEAARALATKPKLLLLDEVSAGLNPAEQLDAIKLIERVHDEFEVAMLYIEHVMRMVMKVSERIIVLNFGEKIAEGTPEEIGSSKDVIKAYLGERYVTG